MYSLLKPIILFFWFIPGLFGQQKQTPKNAIKFNTVGVFTQLYSIQYERVIKNNISLNNTFFYRPQRLIPLGDQIDQLAKNHGLGLTGIKFEHIFMNEAQVGVKGMSPELRFYLGKKKNKAFVSIIGQYENFDMRVPANLSISYKGLIADVKTPVNFGFYTLSGGVLVGKQFNFNKLGIDFVILGPHFGKAYDFLATATSETLSKLNESEKQYILDKIKERFGLAENYFQTTIESNSAKITSTKPVPYLGLRGLGLNLFYRF
jgi:hypothetical protein